MSVSPPNMTLLFHICESAYSHAPFFGPVVEWNSETVTVPFSSASFFDFLLAGSCRVFADVEQSITFLLCPLTKQQISAPCLRARSDVDFIGIDRVKKQRLCLFAEFPPVCGSARYLGSQLSRAGVHRCWAGGPSQRTGSRLGTLPVMV